MATNLAQHPQHNVAVDATFDESRDLEEENQKPRKTDFSDQEVMVRASHVTVAFRSYKERPTSLKETVIRKLRHGRATQYSTFDALEDVSFEIRRGEIFGILGSNGSGKSTLLKVLAQVLRPIKGSIEVNGSVASLIDLGLGFDAELNAIENIYLNGSLYKKTHAEIEKRVDSILEFAELTEFATTPIKYYSAGMNARLGFSVAIDIDPDILLIDEVLAVGDERFQEKCKGVFQNFIEQGKTIAIVSHDLDTVQRIANRVGLLSRGRLVYDGDPATAVRMYRDSHYQTALGHT